MLNGIVYISSRSVASSYAKSKGASVKDIAVFCRMEI